jgi:hypothetical protein
MIGREDFAALVIAPPRSLHVICELTQLAACDVCWADAPTRPCVLSGTGPDGFHVARFAAAFRRGLITGADFTAVTGTVPAFTSATIVYDQLLGGGQA